MAPAFIVIDGKRYAWKDILRLRREQGKAARQPQLALFALKEDSRRLVSGRSRVASWNPCSLIANSLRCEPFPRAAGRVPGRALGQARRPIPAIRKVPKASPARNASGAFYIGDCVDLVLPTRSND
jgi:hypothetical protein